jgi:hypothetical protein
MPKSACVCLLYARAACMRALRACCVCTGPVLIRHDSCASVGLYRPTAFCAGGLSRPTESPLSTQQRTPTWGTSFVASPHQTAPAPRPTPPSRTPSGSTHQHRAYWRRGLWCGFVVRMHRCWLVSLALQRGPRPPARGNWSQIPRSGLERAGRLEQNLPIR